VQVRQNLPRPNTATPSDHPHLFTSSSGHTPPLFSSPPRHPSPRPVPSPCAREPPKSIVATPKTIASKPRSTPPRGQPIHVYDRLVRVRPIHMHAALCSNPSHDRSGGIPQARVAAHKRPSVMHATRCTDSFRLHTGNKQRSKSLQSAGASRSKYLASPKRVQATKCTVLPRSFRGQKGSAAQRLGLLTPRLASPVAPSGLFGAELALFSL
jgi:hypothetical protein